MQADGAGGDALGDVRAGQRAERRDEALGEHEHRGALGDRAARARPPRRAARSRGRRSRRCRRGRARGASAVVTLDGLGQRDVGQVVVVDARLGRAARACSSVRQPSSTSSARARAARSRGRCPTRRRRRSPRGAAARVPPSHSHCSSTQAHRRSMTPRASCGEGSSTRGNCSGLPTRRRTLCGRMRQPLRIASVPMTATGTIGAPVSSARRPTPRLGWPSGPGRVRVPSGKITTTSPRSMIRRAVSIASRSSLPRSTGNAPSELRNHAGKRCVKSSVLATK